MSVHKDLQRKLSDRLGRIAAGMVLEGTKVRVNKGGAASSSVKLPKVPSRVGSVAFVPKDANPAKTDKKSGSCG